MNAGFWAVANSHVGVVRQGNEDAGLASARLLAVADGMGGHAAGEVASSAVIRTLHEGLETLPTEMSAVEDWLLEVVNDAHGFVGDLIANDADRRGMGTTFSALALSDEGIVIGHIGDSRIYRLRDGVMQQVTTDHTYVQMLVDRGEITPAEAAVHPRRNLMMRAIDGLNDVVIDITKFDVQTGDRFLLCSDGLSGVLSNEVISDVMSRPDLTLAVSTLIELTLSAGAPDNVTVVIGEYRAEAEEFTPFVVGSALEETQTIEEEAAPQRRRRFTWWPWALAIVILAIGALSVSAWINKQYYLGSNGLYVTIYNGIPQHLGSMALSEPVEVSNVAMVTLTQVDRDRLADGITVGSLADGEQLVKDLYLRSSICNSDTSPCTR
mgnify:FL=1